VIRVVRYRSLCLLFAKCISHFFSDVTACFDWRIACDLVQLYFTYESPGKHRIKFSAQETSVSTMSAQRATKFIHLRPCKATVVHSLKEYDLAARIHFYSWFLQSVHDGEVEPHFVLLVWVLVFVTWKGESSEQPALECRIFRTHSRTPTSCRKKIVFGVRRVHGVRCQQFAGKNSRE
jgi:hypothetical protein